MASILSALPRELLERVFSFLQCHEIGPCRLVCSAFREISSPYLISRVIYANRLDTIARLQEILNHPYFHRHVTELWYDASKYDGDIAMDWNAYVEACELVPHTLRDEEWCARKQHDNDAWGFITECTNAASQTLDGDRWPGTHQQEIEDYYDSVYARGYNKSFPDYYQLYKAQESIIRNRLPMQILEQAYTKLPRLRRLVYTDWRGLAKSGESYNDTAHRLFGNTLPPLQIFLNNKEVLTFDHLVLSVPPRTTIRSLEVAPHLFDDETLHIRAPKDGRAAIYTSIYQYEPGRIHEFERVFCCLRSLRLPISLGKHSQLVSPLMSEKAMLRPVLAASTNLTHLMLSIEEPPTIKPDTAAEDQNTLLPFQFIMEGSHFPHLRHLDLRRFIIPELWIQTFLQAHAKTLRELRFICCAVDDDPESVAKWAGRFLRLDGVELDANPILIGATFENTTVEQRESRHNESTVFMIEQHEALWLAGRPNFIERVQRWEPLEDSEDGVSWAHTKRWWSRTADDHQGLGKQ